MFSRIRFLVRKHGYRSLPGLPLLVLRKRFRQWKDGAFDRRYGTDTQGIIEPFELDHVGPHGAHSTGHQPIQTPLFHRMIERVGMDMPSTDFIDFGSGKGRAVLLAAHYPFHRVMGVEFSSTLHEIAVQNVRRFNARRNSTVAIDLFRADAAEFEFPLQPLLCFFYNPFDGEVMDKVLARLKASVHAHPRPVHVIYRNPVYAECFARCGFLDLRVKEADYHIYTSRP